MKLLLREVEQKCGGYVRFCFQMTALVLVSEKNLQKLVLVFQEACEKGEIESNYY